MHDSKVKVVVRCRPFLPKELLASRQSPHRAVLCYAKSLQIGGKEFAFDTVFNDDSSQPDVYGSVSYLVEGCLLGYNATVLAYGQTGSG